MNHEPIYVPVASGAGRIDCTTHRGIDHHGGRFTDLGLAQAARDELEKKLGKTINVQVRKAPKKAGA